MSEGIIFYNYGKGAIARLAVGVYSLRKHYKGSVTILSDGEESDELCKRFAADARLGVDVRNAVFDVKKDKNHHYLSKCRLAEHTPYDVSLFLDADTITIGDLTPLLPLALQHEFVVPQFSNWKSSGGTIARRIQQWKTIKPKDIDAAIAFGPAVNTGVMAFTKTSNFMKDWFKIARKGRHLFIPDETSCQVVLYKYPHKMVEWYYNASCRYDKCDDPEVRLIHYHGRKHCRDGLPFYGERWVKAYEEVAALNIAGIQDWTPGTDRKLRHYLSTVNKLA